jgi:hypothetical protein
VPILLTNSISVPIAALSMASSIDRWTLGLCLIYSIAVDSLDKALGVLLFLLHSSSSSVHSGLMDIRFTVSRLSRLRDLTM